MSEVLLSEEGRTGQGASDCLDGFGQAILLLWASIFSSMKEMYWTKSLGLLPVSSPTHTVNIFGLLLNENNISKSGSKKMEESFTRHYKICQ